MRRPVERRRNPGPRRRSGGGRGRRRPGRGGGRGPRGRRRRRRTGRGGFGFGGWGEGTTEQLPALFSVESFVSRLPQEATQRFVHLDGPIDHRAAARGIGPDVDEILVLS